jgi:hypothetical protein
MPGEEIDLVGIGSRRVRRPTVDWSQARLLTDADLNRLLDRARGRSPRRRRRNWLASFAALALMATATLVVYRWWQGRRQEAASFTTELPDEAPAADQAT